MEMPPIALWGVEAALVPLRGGHRNRAYRTLGLAQDLVFKSCRRSEAAMGWLEPVQAAARAAGFAVPQMQRSAAGRLVEAGWVCEAFQPGTLLKATRLPEVRPLVAGLHARTQGIAQRPGFASSQALLALDRGGDVDLGLMPGDVAAACRTAWAGVAGTESVVHGDLNASNVIQCPDGRLALIDWDECRRDLTLFDLGPLGGVVSEAESRALLAWEVACSWALEPARARKLALLL